MKICHVITRMIVGGAQENTWLTVRGLRDRGHDVTLLTGPTRGPEGNLLENQSLEGVRVVEEPALIRDLAPLTDLRAWRRLRAFFRREKFTVVHTHSSKAGVLGRFAAWGVAPLVVHTVHGQPFHPYQSRWRNLLYVAAEKAAARRCHHICAVAQAMIEQSVAAGVAARNQYSLVYSGMELDEYRRQNRPDVELRRQLGIPENVPVIGKVARLFELKGHEFLVDAAADMVREFPRVRFLLIGDGILRGQLERLIESRGLRNNFVFAGLLPPRQIPACMSLLDVLVHLSLREGLPRSVVQGFAAGVPAVAFDLDGTPEVVIDGETGFLCPPGQVAPVRDALLQLLCDPRRARQMGQAGRALVQSRFDWRNMVEQLEKIYLSLQAVKP